MFNLRFTRAEFERAHDRMVEFGFWSKAVAQRHAKLLNQAGTHFDQALVFFKHGRFCLNLTGPLSDFEVDAVRRFADAFGFAYDRYCDLAEKIRQNRELTIQNALERVRSRAQGMQESREIKGVATVLRKEFENLGHQIDSAGVYIPDETARTVEIWFANQQIPEGTEFGPSGFLRLDRRMVSERMWSKSERSWVIPVNRERFAKRIRNLHEEMGASETDVRARLDILPETVYANEANFGAGWISFLTSEPFAEDEMVVACRFADVFGVAYARFRELKEKEDQNRELTLAAAFSVAYARFQDFQRLEAQNIQIQEANRLKSDFLARMSHDLRTPMNAIVGYTRILQRRLKGMIEDRQYRNLENISTSADHLLSLINDILDLSKIEAGGIDIRPEDVDLGQLVSDCMTSVRPLVKAGVQFDERLEQTNTVHTDPDRLQRVVINLLGNAVKFTEAGSITVSLKSVDEWVEVSVVDTGPGIPAADLPFIFDEFRQVYRRRGEGRHGVGALYRREVD